MRDSGCNVIHPDIALDESLSGLTIFAEPIVGYADANDPLFSAFRDKHDITYGRFRPPGWWMDSARTVISIFFPYSPGILSTNEAADDSPSLGWLHGRYEGQQAIDAAMAHLVDMLRKLGHNALAPSLDKRFSSYIGSHCGAPHSNTAYWSNWSERHVAYVAGLGTFGLSGGLITQRGVAGRFSSIITTQHIKSTPRAYSGVYEYCTMCGACARRCPVCAIDINTGKDHTLCSQFLDRVLDEHYPRYACGKCQVGVPCATKLPHPIIRR
jgi:epoxyqueuosine reductase QueG